LVRASTDGVCNLGAPGINSGQCHEDALEHEAVMDESKKQNRVPAVDRALDVIEFVTSRDGEVPLSEILASLPIPRQTLIRILNTLCDRGFLNKSGRRGLYRPGLKFLYLGHRLQDKFDLRTVAWEQMKRLSRETHKTIELSTLDHDQLILLEQIRGSEGVSLYSRVGSVFPFLHAVGAGKIHLCFMDSKKRRKALEKIGMPAVTPHTITDMDALESEIGKIREQGYAVEDQELREGVRRVAAPIVNVSGELAGCIGIAATVFSFEIRDVERYGRLVRDAARDISGRMTC
jgi:DNA-binding IclR family transcriptional regulator